MEWKFSDGTVVRLGGEVEGASVFAQEMRSLLTQPQGVSVTILYPHTLPLDPNDPLSVSLLLREQSLYGPALTAGEFLPTPKLTQSDVPYAVY